MKQASYCLFPTPIGTCAIAWREPANGDASLVVSGFQLPEATAELTGARIAHSAHADQPSEPPLPILTIMDRVRKHLGGELQDFRDIPVDLEGAGPFLQKVCAAARAIPAGQTTTYAGLARVLGYQFLARAVGQALGRNPIPLIIPCHRVLAAHGKPGGFSAHGGRVTKAKLLAIEGAVVNLCLELTPGA
jgi:O-6-methylguanine DNA methyltransferase